MSLSWRSVRQTDVNRCLAIDPRSVGDGLIDRNSALKIWRELQRQLSFNAALIENDSNTLTKIVSFGASVFLRPAFTQQVLQTPKPDLNSRVFAELYARRPILHSAGNLTSPHADGLDLLLLCSSFDLSGLTPAQAEEASMMLPQALVHLHTGYPIRRVLMETTNERMRLLAASSGLWKTIAHFPGEDRALMAVTREDAFGAAGFTILAPLFCHKPPKLGLRGPEKQLLCEAIHGETDATLAAQLGLTLSSIKKRWSTLFAHVATVMPQLLPDRPADLLAETRGSQKRHRILAYARDHPEELRPFRWFPRPIPLGVAPDVFEFPPPAEAKRGEGAFMGAAFHDRAMR